MADEPETVEYTRLLQQAVETARTALADVAYSRDMDLRGVRDRARVAYREVVKNHDKASEIKAKHLSRVAPLVR